MAFVRKATSAVAVSLVTLMAGVNASAQQAAAADKVANTGKFVACVTEGVRESFRQAFYRASQNAIKPGDEETVVRDVIVGHKSSVISLACMSRISGVRLAQMPSINDQQRFSAFYRAHFEEKAFDQALQAVGEIMPAIRAEGLKTLKDRAAFKVSVL